MEAGQIKESETGVPGPKGAKSRNQNAPFFPPATTSQGKLFSSQMGKLRSPRDKQASAAYQTMGRASLVL